MPIELLPFVLATLAVMATPGVTVSALLGTALGQGVRAGFAVEAGAVLGRISMIGVLVLGLSAVNSFMHAAFDWVKLAGAAYLVWAGIKMIIHPPTLALDSGKPAALLPLVRRGFLVLWSNPKALIFFGAFVPQFIITDAPVTPQILLLGAIWVGIAITTDSIYIVLAASVRHLFMGRGSRLIGRVSGTILIGAAVWLATQAKA